MVKTRKKQTFEYHAVNAEKPDIKIHYREKTRSKMVKYINRKRQMSSCVTHNKSGLTGDQLTVHSNSEHPVQGEHV